MRDENTKIQFGRSKKLLSTVDELNTGIQVKQAEKVLPTQIPADRRNKVWFYEVSNMVIYVTRSLLVLHTHTHTQRERERSSISNSIQ